MANIANRQELILVVDDDPGIQNLIRDILELHGHSVLTAGGRGEAIALCEQRGSEISLVFLDVAISETAAFDVFRCIREINPAAKVVITSIYNHDWSAENIFSRGASGFLKKPYRMTEVLGLVGRLQSPP